MNSPTLPSAIVPNSSVETTFMTFFANRCSLIAMEAPSISFDDATVNASSLTGTPAALVLAGPDSPGNVTSCCTVWPGATTTISVNEPRPV